MSDTNDLIRINATVEITVKSLQAIVENAKKITGKDKKVFTGWIRQIRSVT